MSGVTRRAALAGAAGALLGASIGRAEVARAFPLATPEGAVIRNFAIAPALAPADLPGVIMAGTGKGAMLFEFFDYACPFCRLASQELDLLLGPESNLRLGLLHHPVLGEHSAEAALIVLATLRLYGEAAALQLHGRLFEAPGRAGVEKALELAASLSLDPVRLTSDGARSEARVLLDAQAGRALALGLRQTPSFVLGGYAFVGWPGLETAQAMLQAYNSCGGLACAETR